MWRALNAEPGGLSLVCSLSSIIDFAVHMGLHGPPFLAKPEAHAGDPWLLSSLQDPGPSYPYVGSEAMRLELSVELDIQQQATCLFLLEADV